jgi:hypothetical protein
MRFAPSPPFLLALLGSVVSIAACATGLTNETSGEGGSGGDGGGGDPVSTVSASSGASGSCLTAQDCIASSDTCNVGTCINGECVKEPANEGAVCDDGKTCTENDSCQTGACTGSPKFCPSADTCHLGVCDVDSDTCVQIPGNEGSPCVDQDPCTKSGVCMGGTCAPGEPTDCSILDDLCNKGACDPQVGCFQEPIADGTPCQDGLFCTINDHCSAGKCVADPNMCAAPGDVCKIGSCNEVTDTCTAVNGNNGGACNDKNACTTGETCTNGTCGGGAPTNQGGACDDTDACTTVDTCSDGVCVGSAAIVQCTAGDACCPQSCTLADDADCQPTCCGDNQNDFPPAGNCLQGAQWIAWKYVPSCSFNVTRIELHSDNGNVALLADANDFPGATLFEGPLGAPDAQGWIGSDVAPPIALTGGATYWLAENVGVCSTATGGTPPTYYGSFNTLAGPWEGPYMDNFNIFTAHIIGECAP